MGELLDLSSWKRAPHYRFFRSYDRPFFGVCAEVDVTILADRCAGPEAPSFFLAALWLSLRAANRVEAFRLRLRPEGVWRHGRVDAASTLLRDDETFGFAYFPLEEEFDAFHRRGRRILAEARTRRDLDPADHRDDLLHYSVLPWIRFTSFSHARRTDPLDSVPKIVFGKHEKDGDARRMPVSVEVHHALVDGLHVGRFLEAFQAGLLEPRL